MILYDNTLLNDKKKEKNVETTISGFGFFLFCTVQCALKFRMKWVHVTGKESRDLAGKCVLVDFCIIDFGLSFFDTTCELDTNLIQN